MIHRLYKGQVCHLPTARDADENAAVWAYHRREKLWQKWSHEAVFFGAGDDFLAWAPIPKTKPTENPDARECWVLYDGDRVVVQFNTETAVKDYVRRYNLRGKPGIHIVRFREVMSD